MCAQCHVEYICNPGFDAKTGAKIGFDSRLTNHFPFVNADEIEQYYDKIGFRDFKHNLTGAALVKMQHPDTETYFGSTHDKAGATCATCHMPKVKDEKTGKMYTVHWATSPRLHAGNLLDLPQGQDRRTDEQGDRCHEGSL